jgi:hypothetical protein
MAISVGRRRYCSLSRQTWPENASASPAVPSADRARLRIRTARGGSPVGLVQDLIHDTLMNGDGLGGRLRLATLCQAQPEIAIELFRQSRHSHFPSQVCVTVAQQRIYKPWEVTDLERRRAASRSTSQAST